MTLVERGSLVLSCDRHLNDPAQPSSTQKNTRQNEQSFGTIPSGNSSDTESLELKWRDYFRNASQWLDNPNTKTYPTTPHFKPKTTNKDYTSFLAQEEQRRRGAHSAAGEDGVFRVLKVTRMAEVKAHQEKEGPIDRDNNHEESWYDTSTLVALLKDCAKQRNLLRGSELHASIVTRGLLGKNLLVSNNLVNMYAKCGALATAQEVFDELPIRDIVSWNALITGYVKHGDAMQALKCYDEMQLRGFSPNAVTVICVLKACDNIGASNKGQEIHAQIVRDGFLEEDLHVGSALVDMYAKRGLLAEAQKIFDDLPTRDVVSWTTLIGGYAQHGQGEEALSCFEQMQLAGFSPNAVTFVCVLKACGSIGALGKGKEIHSQIAQDGSLKKNIHLGTALVDMYAKCDLLEKAQEVFDELPAWDVPSWTALITGYAQYGHGEKALKYFEQMQVRGFSPNAVTFISALKACGSIGASDKGQDIHAQIQKDKFVEKDYKVATALVDMYAKCGLLGKAQELFDKLCIRTVISWNALISGHTQVENAEEALACFTQMQLEGVAPDAVTFSCILKACSRVGAVAKGLEVHAEIEREGSIKKDMVLGTALVDMYASCGMLAEAQELFDELLIQDVVSWTALIGGFAEHGHGERALNYFEQMRLGGFSPNAFTYVCILKACGSIEALDIGQELHTQIAADGSLDSDIHVGSALVDMYAKCGSLAEAQEVFDKLSVRNLVSWTALIVGYAQHGDGEEALNCFHLMEIEGLFPDAITFASILKACGSIGAANQGQNLHAEIVREGLAEKDMVVGTAIVDMYANYGMLAEAQEVFDNLSVRDLVSWNVLMAGYAQLGKDELVFNFYDRMVGEGEEPEQVTFAIMLNTCTHRGLLDEGQVFFENSSRDYGLIPNLEHFMCMIDLFCRAGHLNMVVAMIEEMPYLANLTLWHSLLNACREWGDLELGRWAFKCATGYDEKDSGAYVSLSNISVAAGRQEDADRFEEARK